MFEQKADKLVINVKGSISSAGGTALEVLGRSPGVSVDRQSSSITINGKNGVAIMINGKMMYLPSDALVQFLAGISADNIDRIELMTTPPANYDSQGNAGYINIVLVHNPYAGVSGSYFFTAGYGIREGGAAGANFNYRSARINVYGNYSLNYDHYIQESSGYVLYNKKHNTVTNTTFSDRNARRFVNNIRIGLDYQLDTSTIIGVLAGGYINRWTMVARNGATVSYDNDPDTLISSVDDPELNLWKNVMANVNYQHTYKPGKVLFFDVNYIYYKDNNPNRYFTDYYDRRKAFLYHEDLRGGKVTPIHFWVLSSDYTMPLSKRVTMNAGGKVSLSRFDNNISSERLKQGSWIPDAGVAASNLLKENIGAVYASFVMKLPKSVSITAGLRYEYTHSRLTSTKSPIVTRKYGELFPTITISKIVNGENSVNFSYSRRITRPAFNDLAPFTIFFDPKTFFSGNPGLRPAIANTVQAGYTFGRYTFYVSYTHEDNTIDNFYFQTQRIDTASNILYLSARNFSYKEYLTVSGSLPFTVTHWWSMQNNISCNFRWISTAFDGAPVMLRNFDYSLLSAQHFILSGTFSAELTGTYTSATYPGTAKCRPLYQIDAGVQKKFASNKDILRLAINDMFNSGSHYRLEERLPSGAIVRRNFDFQLVSYRLTYTRNFGNNALKGKRERATGAEDELKRVQ